jgi:hypothetical protein
MEATKEMKDAFYKWFLENELIKLQQEKQELIDWLENTIKEGTELKKGSNDYMGTTNGILVFAYKKVLDKIKGSD